MLNGRVFMDGSNLASLSWQVSIDWSNLIFAYSHHLRVEDFLDPKF
jgi:hypothetical protein